MVVRYGGAAAFLSHAYRVIIARGGNCVFRAVNDSSPQTANWSPISKLIYSRYVLILYNTNNLRGKKKKKKR